jgi:hypothetical protein
MIDIHIRISRRFIFWAAALMLAFFVLSWALASFGSSSGGVEVGRVQVGARVTVWTVHEGMTRSEVRAALGRPVHVTRFGRGNPEVCWSYRASKPGTSVDARTFCFLHKRVARIQTGHHL